MDMRCIIDGSINYGIKLINDCLFGSMDLCQAISLFMWQH